MAGYERDPVTDLKCLRKVLVWMYPIYAPISPPFMILSPHYVIPLHPSLLTSGENMGVYFSNSLLLLPISLIDTSSSDLRVIYFCVMKHSSSVSGVYIISIFTPASLDIGFKVLSLLCLSILSSIIRSAWILDSSLELPMDAISLALYSI